MNWHTHGMTGPAGLAFGAWGLLELWILLRNRRGATRLSYRSPRCGSNDESGGKRTLMKNAKTLLVAPLGVFASLAWTQASQAAVTVDDNPGWAKPVGLPVYQWNDPAVKTRGVMLVVHGFPVHGKTFDVFATEMAKQGIIVVAPDLRGLGRSWQSGAWSQLSYGTADDDQGSTRAFLYEHGRYTWIPQPGATYIRALDIDNRGRIVGDFGTKPT